MRIAVDVAWMKHNPYLFSSYLAEKIARKQIKIFFMCRCFDRIASAGNVIEHTP